MKDSLTRSGSHMIQRLIRALIGLLLLPVGGLAQATDYVCSTVLENGHLGLVFVQADKREYAEEVARQGASHDEDGVQRPVVVVKQCIVKNGERFWDPKADAMLQSLPM